MIKNKWIDLLVKVVLYALGLVSGVTASAASLI